MESHAYHILSENISRLQNHVCREFGFAQYGEEFDIHLMLELKDIVKKVHFQQMTRLAAQVDLLQKANAASSLNLRIISSFAGLIAMLPKEENTSVIKEQELCTHYSDPALTPSFDDPDNDIFFRWTGTMSDDSQAVPKRSISLEQPDVMVSWAEGAQIGKTIGFAEMKAAANGDNNYLITKDLIRLSGFSKSAIDQRNVSACLST
ncbi:hypothetical protein G6F70_006497 [Rhizopus microsporus]|nr:hypothetical protein G6F71_006393 [Rhizopus microsporus]KAG1197603.1 hypothetical protein G6F70_006497 [Rhizopus microsporus]KAG1209378.1 hypothetical protein G6F69_006418 [Rhizopus microsporus]KAG1230853.1 hypothetical protein G6F67_006165 [Rhizopus microsporus]KAG1263171.1 hypothetical protein G6F68_005359 [Rhizopus microsporus]